MLNCFILDLKPVIQNELAIHKPATLSDAIALVKLVEDRFRDPRVQQPKPISWRLPATETANPHPPRWVDSAPILPLPLPPSPGNPSKIPLPIRRLTAAELHSR
nr:Ty3/gypsy retrotransposon protein [Ipomoea batatas]